MKKTMAALTLTAVTTAVAATATFNVAPVQAQLVCPGPPYWCTTWRGCDENDPDDCRTVIYYKTTPDTPLPMPF